MNELFVVALIIFFIPLSVSMFLFCRLAIRNSELYGNCVREMLAERNG